MPAMEQNMNSTVNLPSDTINITFEFIQPGSDEVSKSGNVIISERTGDQFAEVAHCSPGDPSGSHGESNVPAQIMSTNDVNSSSRNCGTQELLKSVVLEQMKNRVAERRTSEKSASSSSQLSISNPQQPLISYPPQLSISYPPQLSISYPPQLSISNPQQPLIPNSRKRPSAINLRIQNGQVVERVYVKTPVQTQSLQKEKTSTIRPTRVESEKTANDKNVEDVADDNEMGGASLRNIEVNIEPATSNVEGTQITNPTKLAIRNFLRKKSAAKVNETNRKSIEDNTDPEVQIVSTIGKVAVSNVCNKDKACSDQPSNVGKDGISVSARTESQKQPEVATIVDSSSPNPVQSRVNSEQSPNDLTSTVVQNKNDEPSNEPPDVTESNAERSDKENNLGTSDGTLATEVSPTTREVDIVVLPSLLQPNVPKKTVKKKAEKPPRQQSGIKKKKFPCECVECGKMLTSTKQLHTHMNIHYDRRPHKCTECGKAFRQSNHLAKHKLIHTGEKPFACQYCERAFNTCYLRRDHERIHTGEKPCKCTVCSKKFRTISMLTKHEAGVHNLHAKSGTTVKEKIKKVFKCKICDKTFSWSSALSAHKKSHADVWGYKCKKCNKTFKNNSALWNHKRTHSKEKPFECDLCGQRLKRRGNLKRHILTQHEPDEAEECLKTSKEFKNFRTKKKQSND